MTATATTATWKSPSHTHSHSQSRSSRPATTPRGYTPAQSVGQNMPPQLSPHTRSPKPTNPRSPSPNYFGFIVGDDADPPNSGPGLHTKQNWNFPTSSRSVAPSSTNRHVSNESNPEFELFRRQSEKNGFSLSSNVSGLNTPKPIVPTPNVRRAEDSSASPRSKKPRDANVERGPPTEISFLDLGQNDSPQSMTPKHTVADHQHARLSLPASELQLPLEALKKQQRSDTLPHPAPVDSFALISPTEVAQILKQHSDDILLLDLRVYPQYAASRISGALNLCIPTTLLKRPAFTVQKLADTFTSEHDKQLFSKWRNAKYIIVYDANSMLAKEATIPLNVLKKFNTEGWNGNGLVIKGGMLSFKKAFPQLVDQGPAGSGKGASTKPLQISPPNQTFLPVAGGCSMPTSENAANPFFGNIRQNMDLLDGVGQVPIQRPSDMSSPEENELPDWLRKAAVPSDQGKQVSDRFLAIEKTEQKRMQQALSGSVSYGNSINQSSSEQIQVAGIEKGSKNRYNNIFPFEHSRVRLQNCPSYDCDYVNASYVQASYSDRKYIATQAPIPATFGDFWRVVWEQDVRVIVMLTAESEGGQLKSHPYWNSGEYGSLKLKQLTEKKVSLDLKKSVEKETPTKRPTLGPRRSTTSNSTPSEKKFPDVMKSATPEPSIVMVRHFTLSHSSHPFLPMREITQIQYTQWPDFGAPASPRSILSMIDIVNKYQNRSSPVTSAFATRDQRPIVVHCSAGCGRTGTFCTIDSVIDMIKRQKSEKSDRNQDTMDVDSDNDWISRDDIDLVAKTVEDFRHQRLSMVQNLRQFVLCYESILQWLHDNATTTKR